MSGGCLCQETAYKCIFVWSHITKLHCECLLHRFLNYLKKKWKHIQFCAPFVDWVINQDLSGSNIFHPVFWPQVKYQDVKSNNLEKIIYLVIDLLHNLFMMLKNEGENLKYSLLQTHILICITYRLDSKNNPPEAARVATSIKFFNVEKT